MKRLDVEKRVRTERLESITSELQRKLRPMCGSMDDDIFREMIEQMAELQLKYELLEKPAVS